jgi:pyruvate-formate lyase
VIARPPPSARVQRLREHAAAAAHGRFDVSDRDLAAARAWIASAAEPAHIVRRGMLARDILLSLEPVIDPDELLVGKYPMRQLSAAEREELSAWCRTGEPATSRALGQRSHMAIDYERLLRLGVSGVRAQIEGFRARLDASRPDDQAKDFFYRACLEALDGMTDLARRYATRADGMAAAEADPGRAAELAEIARVCRKVPAEPAETFREAVQSAHFATFCQCAGNQMLLFQLGRPDRYLLPYYRADMSAGRLSEEQAQELIDCLGIVLNEYTPRGLAVGFMVGGRDSSGLDASNELTALFVRSADHVRLAYPGIGLCWHRDLPRPLLDLACHILARGASHPALFNDETITRGLLRLGLPHRDACLYTHSTCVEITPVAISNVYVASPYHNLVRFLHESLGIGPAGKGTAGSGPGAPAAGAAPYWPDFDALFTRYRQLLSQAIAAGVTQENAAMASRAQAGGFPLLSCFVNDCLARGRDIDAGGARVNWLEPSFVGLANLVDSLYAIRTLVFERRALTLERLREAMLADYEGHEDVRALVSGLPKYGNDDARVDAIAGEVTRFLVAECDRHRSYWGDAVVPGLFCWIMHGELGRQTAASADGRSSGLPLADGSGPAQGRELCGPTAMVRSVTSWDHAPMIGGIAVNMKLPAAADPDDLVRPLAGLLESFLALGGFEAQVNVVSAETLRDARAHPERYRDLVVRIAGYSDYFVGLPADIQDELVRRTELGV